MAGEADVDRAVEAARAALDGPWGKTPPTERSRLLHALADAIVANRKELAELEVRNVGKAISSVKAELNQAVEVGSLISTAHRDRVHGFVERGRAEGAEVVTGGTIGDGMGAFYPPTVLAGVESPMSVAQEEIFGPVVTLIPFEDEKDAIRIANDVQYGLMATVRTGDPARGHRVASRIKAGTVGINMPYTAFPGIPFGGYKQSGFGRELGIETLELYLETKSVLVSTSPKPINPFGL
jgi:acyl-CoA reductase-like NAD-dependent aldehyde dehydrogenase